MLKVVALLLISSVAAQIANGGPPLSMVDAREGLGFGDTGSKAHSPDETNRLLQEHFRELDKNGDGHIDYQEMDRQFRRHMDTKFKEATADTEAVLRTTFQSYDSDNSGSMSWDEYASAMGGEQIGLQERDHFEFFDYDKNNEFSFHEYKESNDPFKSSRREEFVAYEAGLEIDLINEGSKLPGFTWEQVG
jgi:hypothetical protein